MIVPLLFPFDRLEQRAEVARAEALIALALDDLEEERPRFGIVVVAGRLLEEDLQEVLVRPRAVDQDLELSQRVDALVDLADPEPNSIMVFLNDDHPPIPERMQFCLQGELVP